MGRVLFIFLDGVGIGAPDPEVNPFFQAKLPTLTGALSGELPSLSRPDPRGSWGKAFPLDACLGVAGTPQSGTGQVALLTGLNAPRVFGRHFGPWPPVRLQAALREESFLARARKAGVDVAFANAYPRGYPGGRDSKRIAAIPLAALAAGLLTRDHTALAEGCAVASEIVNDRWTRRLDEAVIPAITPEEAGRTLGELTRHSGLTLYAHYHTDAAGHRGGMQGGVSALERVDRFLSGIRDTLPNDALLLIASDHGNIEDIRVGHTRNPVLGLALGTGARDLPVPRTIAALRALVLSRMTR